MKMIGFVLIMVPRSGVPPPHHPPNKLASDVGPIKKKHFASSEIIEPDSTRKTTNLTDSHRYQRREGHSTMNCELNAIFFCCFVRLTVSNCDVIRQEARSIS